MCRALQREGHEVMVIDDLSTGHRKATGEFPLLVASLLEPALIDKAMVRFRPDVVFHFAALSVVSESVVDPISYYRNNVTGTVCLLESMRRHDVDRIVFSSSAAVYGLPSSQVVDEMQPMLPINPYGTTKMVVERLLDEAARAYGLRAVSLRYFNAAGADPDGDLGESHEPETHLIPNALRAADGMAKLCVYGGDYETQDGTCVRDYVHVADLARAHLNAAAFMEHRTGSHHFNLGTGVGCSVMQIIDAVRRVTGRSVVFEMAPRRAGDPDRLVAANRLAFEQLGWSPAMSDVETLVSSAWNWHLHRKY
jgi:UDP-glucose 4-epimerase